LYPQTIIIKINLKKRLRKARKKNKAKIGRMKEIISIRA
jgi:hypothetical protein